MSAAEELSFLKDDLQKSSQEFRKSSRTDYGRQIDIRMPLGYHAQVRKAWEQYETDSLFRYLVNRSVDFAANGFEWELPLPIQENLFTRIVKRIRGNDPVDKIQQEKIVWDVWSARMNEDVPNVIPGIDEVIKWQVKHLQLNGMAPMEWEWQTVDIGGQKYELPIRMTIHNSLSILLLRKTDAASETAGFLDERAFLRLTALGLKYLLEGSETGEIGIYTSPPLAATNGKNGKLTSKDWKELSLMRPSQIKTDLEAFIIKYNWSPGDNTALLRGKTVDIGQGLYPSVPHAGLFPVYMQRQALFAADLSILDGIINFILDWEIGNDAKDHQNRLVNQPQPEQKNSSGTVVRKSTIAQVKEMIESSRRGNTMEIFRPYWVKPNILIPRTESLTNRDKYIQPMTEMLMAFGILMTGSDRNPRALQLNVSNFEQILENMRQRHIKRYWEALAAQIVRRNKGKLTTIPNMIFRPLNTQDAAFRTALFQLAKIGKISSETLLQAHGLDIRTELMRVAQEIRTGQTALLDQNVPLAFVQGVRQPPAPSRRGAKRPAARPSSDNSDTETESDGDANNSGEES